MTPGLLRSRETAGPAPRTQSRRAWPSRQSCFKAFPQVETTKALHMAQLCFMTHLSPPAVSQPLFSSTSAIGPSVLCPWGGHLAPFEKPTRIGRRQVFQFQKAPGFSSAVTLIRMGCSTRSRRGGAPEMVFLAQGRPESISFKKESGRLPADSYS